MKMTERGCSECFVWSVQCLVICQAVLTRLLPFCHRLHHEKQDTGKNYIFNNFNFQGEQSTIVTYADSSILPDSLLEALMNTLEYLTFIHQATFQIHLVLLY